MFRSLCQFIISATICAFFILFSYVPANSLVVKIDTRQEHCEFGRIFFVSIRVTFFPGDSPRANADVDGLTREIGALNSIFTTVCSNANVRRLNDNFNMMISQRVSVFNRCSADMNAYSGSGNVRPLTIITKRKTDLITEIDNIITYWMTMDAFARINASQLSDAVYGAAEIFSTAAGKFGLAKNAARNALIGKDIYVGLGEILLDQTKSTAKAEAKSTLFEAAAAGNVRAKVDTMSYYMLLYTYKKMHGFVPVSISTERCLDG